MVELDKKKYLTTSQAAKLMCVSPDTILKWVKAGKLKSSRTLGGHLRISVEELKKLPLIQESEVFKEVTEIPAIPSFQHCWEYFSQGEEVKEGCKDCISYKARAKRCYELKDIPEGFGCLRYGCGSSCADCFYYKLVKGKKINILIVTNCVRLKKNFAKNEPLNFNVSMVDNEYECAKIIQEFRPDYVIIDCSLGKKRTEMICQSLSLDPRIPVPRIILTSKIPVKKIFCHCHICGWIGKPFSAKQIQEYLNNLESSEIAKKNS